MNRDFIINRFILIWILLLIICFYPGSNCQGQENGLPSVRNFTAQDYKAHPQNFAITRGTDGLMYFANFAGVLQFDGYFWRLIPTVKTSRITALATGNNGIVYCGAYGEFGYLKTFSGGNMIYENYQVKNEILHQLGKNIIAIFFTPDGPVFISSKSLLNIKTGKTWTPGDEIVSAFYPDGKLFLQLKNKGLILFQNNTSVAVNGGQLFSGAFEIRSVLINEAGKTVIATSTQGLYIIENNGIKPFPTEADKLFRTGIITCGVRLTGSGFAFGTTRNGIICIDNNGILRHIINKKAGLNDDYIHNLFYDKNGILWAAMNNGIAMMEIPSALNYFDEKAGLEGGINAICRFKGSLFAATYQGLFVFDKQQRSFQEIPGIKTACWNLLPSGGELLAACSEGLFSVNGSSASKIYDGFCLSLASDLKENPSIYIGTPNGLYRLSPGNSKPMKTGDAMEEVKGLITDSHGKIWGLLSSDKIFKYDPEIAKIRVFDSTNGLIETSGAGVALWNNSIVALLRSGVYKFDEASEKFNKIKLTDSTDKTGDWFSLMTGDSNGQLWVCSGDQKNVRKLLKKGSFYSSFQSELLPVSERVIWCVYPDASGLTWLGGPEGLIRYNPAIRKNISGDFPSMIRMVSLLNDSVLFFGNSVSADNTTNTSVPAIEYKNNTIRFDFSSPFYAAKGLTQYQYKLEGFDDTWSDWMAINNKEYTNLSYGNYVFKVRAMNVYGKISTESKWAFRILPPWYFEWWAYVLYTLFAGSLFYLIVRIRNRQLMNEKRILEQKIDERTAEVTKQKEEILQQSEELSNKNSELEKINTLVKSINSEINFNSLLQSLLEKMRMIRSVERSAALIFDESEQVFKFKAAFGWDFSLLENIRLSASQSEQLYLAGAEEVYEDIFLKNKLTGFIDYESLKGLEPPKAILVVVIKIYDRIEAYLVLENMIREDAFDNKDLSFILHTKEHIISAFIKTKILEDLQTTFNNLKDAQDQLVQSEKLASLGQLTAGIAHEIQNPLNFVNNFSVLSIDLAKELREYIDEQKDNIDVKVSGDMYEVLDMIEGNVKKINDHGKRASSIVKGMLQHSRGRTGEFEIVDINNMVEEYVNLAFHGMRAKDSSFNTKITTSLDPDAGKISVVPQDISRVILNIMNNAFYAVTERNKKNEPSYAPEVTISTKRKGKNVEIRLRDNGTGIPPHVLEKIFNPFFTTKPTGQGTGLGLSMSFDIITQLHKGKLEVNTGEGEFTEFVITLPEKN